MKRFNFTDIARGIAILYIIQCHVCNYHVAWIDSWAMPVFFVIMGMFFKPTVTWRDMLVKKMRTILLPFVILSIPSFIQYSVSLPLKDFIKIIIDPFNCMHGVGWFLVCMFWCYLIYYGIHRVAKGRILVKLSICLFISVFFYYLSAVRLDVVGGHRLVLPLFMSTSLTCIALIAVGDLLRNYLFLDKVKSRKILFISVMGSVCTFLFTFKGGEMIINYYYDQSYIFWFANSVVGSIAILEISKYLPSFMTFFGKHSLLMLMVHPYVKRILLLFFEPTMISLIIIILVTSLFVYILAKYLPITEGKLYKNGIV